MGGLLRIEPPEKGDFEFEPLDAIKRIRLVGCGGKHDYLEIAFLAESVDTVRVGIGMKNYGCFVDEKGQIGGSPV